MVDGSQQGEDGVVWWREPKNCSVVCIHARPNQDGVVAFGMAGISWPLWPLESFAPFMVLGSMNAARLPN